MNKIDLLQSDDADPRDIDGPTDEHPLRPAHIDETREEMKHFKERTETVAPPVPDVAKLRKGP